MVDGLKAFRKFQIGREVKNGGSKGSAVAATAQIRGVGTWRDDRKRTYPDEDIGYLGGKGRNYLPRAGAGVRLAPTPLTYEQFPYILQASIEGANVGIVDTGASATPYIYTCNVPNVPADISTTSTGIAFANATGVITDSNNGFGFLKVGDLIIVTGTDSGTNDGTYVLTAAAAGSITTSDTIQDESAAENITVERAIMTHTLEVGDNKQAWEAAHGFVSSWTVEGQGGVETDALMMSAEWGARIWSKTTFTTVGAPTVVESLFPRTSLKIDAVGGTIGTTAKTGMMLSFSLTYDSGLRALYTGGGNTYFETAELRTDPLFMLSIDLLETADMLTQYDNWIAGTPILLQLREVGPAVGTAGDTYTYKNVIFNLPGSWENFSEDKIAADGAIFRTGTFRSHYDATAAIGPSVIVVNELASLT